MIFCSNCFRDTEIKALIQSNSMIGNCPTCKSEEQFLYDTESDEYLNGIFDKLILIYSPEKDEGKFIKNELLESWDIFAEIEPDHVYEIIKNISKELYFDSPELFEEIGRASWRERV